MSQVAKLARVLFPVFLMIGWFLLSATVTIVFAQELLYAKRAGGTLPSRDAGRAIAVDNEGNALATGYFSKTATFGIDEPNETVLEATSYSFDTFLAKYAPNGTLLWVMQAEGRDIRGEGLTVDAEGNALVTGRFTGTATFGRGELHETTLGSRVGQRGFVAKYALNGSLHWAKQADIGVYSNAQGDGIAVDATGNALVTGTFEGTVVLGNGEPNEMTLEAPDFYFNIFLAKYAPNGALLWATQADGWKGSSFRDRLLGIAVDAAGNAIVTGKFVGTATFGRGAPNETTLRTQSSSDIFIAKYAPNGALLWATQTTGWGRNEGRGIAVDVAGNIVVTGRFQAPTTFGLGEPNETSLEDEASPEPNNPSLGTGHIGVFVAKYADRKSVV